MKTPSYPGINRFRPCEDLVEFLLSHVAQTGASSVEMVAIDPRGLQAAHERASATRGEKPTERQVIGFAECGSSGNQLPITTAKYLLS
jgi:hypothetical protein